MSKKQPTRGESLAKAIISEYKPRSVEDMQNALKDVFGPMFEAMLNGEMENHLGYDNNARGKKETANRRNGYTHKTLKTSAGEVPIDVPRDRDGSFEPQIVQKRQTDVSSIEGKVLAMYARGMSQRDISSTIDDIYGFKLSARQISNITDCVLDELNEWQNYSGTLVKTKIDKFLNVSGSRHCSIKQQCREVALCWRDVPDG